MMLVCKKTYIKSTPLSFDLSIENNQSSYQCEGQAAMLETSSSSAEQADIETAREQTACSVGTELQMSPFIQQVCSRSRIVSTSPFFELSVEETVSSFQCGVTLPYSITSRSPRSPRSGSDQNEPGLVSECARTDPSGRKLFHCTDECMPCLILAVTGGCTLGVSCKFCHDCPEAAKRLSAKRIQERKVRARQRRRSSTTSWQEHSVPELTPQIGTVVSIESGRAEDRVIGQPVQAHLIVSL